MKRTFTFFLVILISSITISSKAQLLFKDDFTYPVSPNLSGQGGWSNTGVTTVNKISVVAPGLSYTGYAGSNIGNTSLMKNIYPGDILLRSFETQTSGRVYYAFMVRVDSLGNNTTGTYTTGLDEAGGPTNYNTLLYIIKVNSSIYKMGFRGKPDDTNMVFAANFNIATTYFVVLKFAFVAGTDNDSSSIFIFTGSIPSTEPPPSYSSTNGIDMKNIGQVVLNSNDIGGNNAFSQVKVDGIRVGKTWATSVLASVNQISNEIPSDFKLNQNYPNPFNPITSLEFAVSELGFVSLKIHDMMGKEIATLVNNNLNPGTYKYDFDASGLASGIYFYTMEANKFTETKRMILLK